METVNSFPGVFRHAPYLRGTINSLCLLCFVLVFLAAPERTPLIMYELRLHASASFLKQQNNAEI